MLKAEQMGLLSLVFEWPPFSSSGIFTSVEALALLPGLTFALGLPASGLLALEASTECAFVGKGSKCMVTLGSVFSLVICSSKGRLPIPSGWMDSTSLAKIVNSSLSARNNCGMVTFANEGGGSAE